MSRVSRLNERNFDREVLESEVPVLVDFGASWCLACKAVEPMLDELAWEYAGRIKIGRLNVDQNRKKALEYQIRGVPTFILFRSSQLIAQRVGAQSKKQLEEMMLLAVGDI